LSHQTQAAGRNDTRCHILGGGSKSAEKVLRIIWMAPNKLGKMII
jgi:hypothetical protein